jgi:hypothetical protein
MKIRVERPCTQQDLYDNLDKNIEITEKFTNEFKEARKILGTKKIN